MAMATSFFELLGLSGAPDAPSVSCASPAICQSFDRDERTARITQRVADPMAEELVDLNAPRAVRKNSTRESCVCGVPQPGDLCGDAHEEDMELIQQLPPVQSRISSAWGEEDYIHDNRTTVISRLSRRGAAGAVQPLTIRGASVDVKSRAVELNAAIEAHGPKREAKARWKANGGIERWGAAAWKQEPETPERNFVASDTGMGGAMRAICLNFEPAQVSSTPPKAPLRKLGDGLQAGASQKPPSNARSHPDWHASLTRANTGI